MINAVFVILHYQNIDDTINCINSIKKLYVPKDFKYNIVVVDNKSPNNSGLKLHDLYNDDEFIDIILLDKNYGFSYSNNIGYKRALKYNPNIILMSNNDILIEDNKFFEKLLDSYKVNSKDCEIISPDIVNLEGFNQNPLRDNYINLNGAIKNYLYKSFLILSLHIPIVRKKIYEFEKNRINNWMLNYYKNKKNDCRYDFVPFGAFIIYFDRWIEKEQIAFPSNTFMYLEEDFLSVYIKRKKYKIFYDNSLVVKHLEGRSVSSSIKNNYKKIIFKYSNEKKALLKYIKYLKRRV